MSMLEQRLQQQFFESADLLYQAAESLAGPLEQATQTLLGCLTGGGKLLLTGGALAPHFARLCVGGFERERPPLAALALAAGDATLQLQAIGLPGDVLMIVDAGPADWRAAVTAAHEKDMAVVAFTGPAPGWADALTETDVWMAVPHERVARVHELQLLGLHALADALDLQLMGETDPL
jgi:D-sedoheptulose 7-phosphate isomerase